LSAPPDAVLDGPVVLVNRAVDLFTRFGGDVWACWDRPDSRELQGLLRPALEAGMKPWCWGNPYRGASWGRGYQYHFRGVCLGLPILDTRLPFPSSDMDGKGRPGHFTVLHAACSCILFGAREIRTIGVDMGEDHPGREYELPRWESFVAKATENGIHISPWLASDPQKV
jgi:hypothetical protein